MTVGRCAFLISLLPVTACLAQHDHHPPPSAAGAGRSLACSGYDDLLAETIIGPFGLSAVLRASSGEYGGKDESDCVFQLWLDTPGKKEGDRHNAIADIGDWNRPYVVRPFGYTRDGKNIVVSVRGDGQLSIYDFRAATGDSVEYDVTPYSRRIKQLRCGGSVTVSGVTNAGAIVIEPDSQNACRNRLRAVLTSPSRAPVDLKPGQQIVPLYRKDND